MAASKDRTVEVLSSSLEEGHTSTIPEASKLLRSDAGLVTMLSIVAWFLMLGQSTASASRAGLTQPDCAFPSTWLGLSPWSARESKLRRLMGSLGLAAAAALAARTAVARPSASVQRSASGLYQAPVVRLQLTAFCPSMIVARAVCHN